MAEERKYYVICGDNCKFESMTKEQIIAAIVEATGNVPGDIDEAFITHIKETNAEENLYFWVGTQAEWNALDPKPENTYPIITNDSSLADAIAAHNESTEAHQEAIGAHNADANAHSELFGTKQTKTESLEEATSIGANDFIPFYNATNGNKKIKAGKLLSTYSVEELWNCGSEVPSTQGQTTITLSEAPYDFDAIALVYRQDEVGGGHKQVVSPIYPKVLSLSGASNAYFDIIVRNYAGTMYRIFRVTGTGKTGSILAAAGTDADNSKLIIVKIYGIKF